MDDLWEKHRPLLDDAYRAWRTRDHWSAFPESPSPRVWGENAAAAGLTAFEAYRGEAFALDTPGADGWVAPEQPPTGIEWDIRYPHLTSDGVPLLVSASQAALPAWRDAGPHRRAGLVVEILHRLAERSFELAHAVMHTTGQGFVMAFQAGAAHALDRALEAVAVAVHEMTAVPPEAEWVKPAGRDRFQRLHKRYHIVPRGIGLVIGCTTFPTWNGFPGLFASLVCGNPVIVKPHPHAVLPLAIATRIARQTLAEHGFDPNLVTLAVEADGEGLARVLATQADVRIIDYTGSSAFGAWLEENARHAVVYAEKSAVNCALLESTDNFTGMTANLAYSLALYSGQMCTTPRVFLVPAGGIATDVGKRGVDDIVAALRTALADLTAEPKRAAALLGAIVDGRVAARVEEAMHREDVAIPSRRLEHPDFPAALVRTPVVLRTRFDTDDAYRAEWFGPIAFIVETPSPEVSLTLWEDITRHSGGLTASVYSTDPAFLRQAEDIATRTGVLTALNFTGDTYVNQTAAFSDFHGSAANRAATAAMTDPAFVTHRFHIAEIRQQR